ncbi:MAG: hypothetical protein HYU64_12765 [Armatimonadetes bacterium]|nr:hypothetical protein [Armatimonadota bacterium]
MRIESLNPNGFFSYSGRPSPGARDEMAGKLAYLQVRIAQEKSVRGNVSTETAVLNQARQAAFRGDLDGAERLFRRAIASLESSKVAVTKSRDRKADPQEVSPPVGTAPEEATRTYQDASDDSSVSFKAPARLTPGAAEYWVRAHEGEHVAQEVAQAIREGKTIVNIAVSIFYRYSAEAGETIAVGGRTEITTRDRYEYGAGRHTAALAYGKYASRLTSLPGAQMDRWS